MPLEIVDGVVLQRFHHIRHEPFGVDVSDFRRRIPGDNEIAGGLHEVCFAKPDASIDKQRVVGETRILADLHGGCPCQLIRFALDVSVESERRVEPPRGVGLVVIPAFVAALHRGRRLGRRPLTADLDGDGNGSRTIIRGELAQTLQVLLAHPVHDEPIRGKQAKPAAVLLNRVQWSDPSVELL